jgi:hypothetical protein
MRKHWIHPLLLTITPTLMLYATNIRELDFVAVVRSLVASLIIFGVIYLVLRLLLRNKDRAAIITSFLAITFFSYGHLQKALLSIPLIGSVVGRTSIMVPVLLVIWGLLVFWLFRNQGSATKVHYPLNCFALVLFAVPILQIGSFQVAQIASNLKARDQSTADVISQKSTPDIYYIILDSYGREDEILNRFGIDNSKFIDQLKSTGFYVGDCSLSNYSYTPASIGSSLNMNYLSNLTDEPENSRNVSKVYDLLTNNLVRRMLKSAGYKIVSFDTGYSWINWHDSDVYYGNPSFYLTDRFFYPFETLLIDTTALRILTKHDLFEIKGVKSVPIDYVQSHVKKTFNVLDNLKKTTEISSPKFVYAHLLVPHSPFVFNPDGTSNWKNYYDEHTGKKSGDINAIEGYSNNIQFIDNQILAVIKEILDNSIRDPIIIVQGDHSTHITTLYNKYPILNAYYFPDQDYSKLYPNISPVNSFRIIFSQYFGLEYPPLVDQSLASDINRPFQRDLADPQSPACKALGY